MKIKKNICNKIKEINIAGGFVQLSYVLHFRYYFRGQNNIDSFLIRDRNFPLIQSLSKNVNF
jgi:hypothetical protein